MNLAEGSGTESLWLLEVMLVSILSACQQVVVVLVVASVLCVNPARSSETGRTGDENQAPTKSEQKTKEADTAQPPDGLDVRALFARDSDARKPLTKLMRAYVEKDVCSDPVAAVINDAFFETIKRSREAGIRGKQMTRYYGLPARAWNGFKNFMDLSFDTRGNILMSIETSSLVLDKDVKAHHQSSACYGSQHWLDVYHDRIVSDVMELASSFGVTDESRRAEMQANAKKDLAKLGGEDTAARISDTLATWFDDIRLKPTSGSEQASTWTEKEVKEKVAKILSICDSRDAILQDISEKANRYQRGKLMIGVSSVVESVTAILAYTPTILSPIAQVVELAFDQSTGGEEEMKIINCAYLAKRQESRKTSLMQQAYWALNGYRKASLTHNPALMACCESIIRRMIGNDGAAEVLQSSREFTGAQITQSSSTTKKTASEATLTAF